SDHGYVSTTYKEQGVTNVRELVYLNSAAGIANNKEMAYVAATRAKEETHLFTDNAALVYKQIERGSDKTVARELKAAKNEWMAGKETRQPERVKEAKEAKEGVTNEKDRGFAEIGRRIEGEAAPAFGGSDRGREAGQAAERGGIDRDSGAVGAGHGRLGGRDTADAGQHRPENQGTERHVQRPDQGH